MKTPVVSILVALTLASTSLAVDPSPDGGYPNQNTAEGEDALFSLTTGRSNTAIGFDALYHNTGGINNTATGTNALLNNTSGSNNTAAGFEALNANTTGTQNTATGVKALFTNTSGGQNTALGVQALFFNTTGASNTAVGCVALWANTTGTFNTATGFNTLEGNTTGSQNTADGSGVLFNNTTGANNTATGASALAGNSTGNNNTASGYLALLNNTTGSFNIGLGDNAGINLTKGSYNIDIGNDGVAGESSTIRIGTKTEQSNTYIAGINGVTVAGGVGVIIDSNGHLGTVVSSLRFKDSIRPMDQASEAVLALKPVTFRYKKELDPQAIPQFGLVAEEVAKVDPDLVACDDQGKPYTVRYEAVNAMLLNEFLKEHKKTEEQANKIERLEAQLQQMTARLDAKGL
jgi:trimeric autotransporter adhesin